MYDTISLFGEQKYVDKFPDMELIYQEDLFLECRLYDVELTVTAKTNNDHDLNIFEATVLNLLGSVSWSVDKIADKSCLEKDFVSAICDSLRQQEYIDASNVLTEKGKKYTEQWPNKDAENNVGTQQMRLLVLPMSGRVFMLLPKNNNYSCKGECNGQWFHMYINQEVAGRVRQINGRYLAVKKEIRDEVIEDYKVRKAIRKYNKEQIQKKARIHLAKQGAIIASKTGSKVFLHVKCGVQQGLVDEVAVSAGTKIVNGELVSYIKENYGNYFRELQSRGTMIKSDIDNDDSYNKEIDNEKYSKIQQAWRAMKLIDDINSPDALQQALRQIQENINNLYIVTEHALGYYFAKYPLSKSQLTLLVNKRNEKNKAWLLDKAKELGLDYKNAKTIFSHLNPRRINTYYKSKQPDFYAVLPLVIATTVYGHRHELKMAGKSCHSLLNDLEQLSNSSKNLRHGSEETNKARYAQYKHLRKTVKILVTNLLPDCPLDGESAVSAVNASQDRLNAIVSLQHFGIYVNDNMEGALREDMLAVSPYYKGNKMLSSVEMVNVLYRIFENYLRSWSCDLSENNTKSQELADLVAKRTSQKLPESLKNVNVSMIRAARVNEGASLGAYTLVVFSRLSDDNNIKKLCDAVDIFGTIGEIISLRGHGNNTELNLSLNNNKKIKLRDQALSCIKEMEKING